MNANTYLAFAKRIRFNAQKALGFRDIHLAKITVKQYKKLQKEFPYELEDISWLHRDFETITDDVKNALTAIACELNKFILLPPDKANSQTRFDEKKDEPKVIHQEIHKTYVTGDVYNSVGGSVYKDIDGNIITDNNKSNINLKHKDDHRTHHEKKYNIPLFSTIIKVSFCVVFVIATLFLWNKVNNQYELNDINLANNIIDTLNSANMDNPGDLGKIKGAYNSYKALDGKYQSLPRIRSLQQGFDIVCVFREEFNNKYVCLLSSDGQAKVYQMRNALSAFVKTAEQKKSLFIPTISNNNVLEWLFFVLQILSYIAAIITILDFINRFLKRNQGNI